ncbi:MAG: 16S rRNA (uracil(1498)-N(3))-methyltransferase [Jatrophihabitans sp.]
MTPPRFFVDALPDGELITLAGAEGRHAATVRRLQVGETITIGDGCGTVRAGEVVEVGRDTLVARCASTSYIPAADPRLVVVQALAKTDRGELAVELMTELGVDEIVPWSAARSIVQWRGDRAAKSREKWVSTAREAAKQSRRSWIPTVAQLQNSRQVAERLRTAATAVVLHESASVSLAEVQLPSAGDVVLVVGPEGGISDDELSLFADAAATAVRLGPDVLRTSTAGAAACAALSVRLGRWA